MRFEPKDFTGSAIIAATLIALFAHGTDRHQQTHLPHIADAGGSATTANAVETIAFVGFDVLPMTGEGMLRGQIVIVRDGVISRIGRVGVLEVPPDARTIEGDGRGVILPGLVDAHVHLPEAREDFLPLFLATGVTTVFNLEGDERHLALRERARAPSFKGPRMFTSGPFQNDGNVRTAADARAAVDQHVAAGYDFIKIHGRLSEVAYAALTDAAREHGLAVVGHAPRNLPFSAVLEHGQVGVVHAEELIYTGLQDLDGQKAVELGGLMAEAGTWLTPTMSTFQSIEEQWASAEGLAARLARPEAAWLPPSLRRSWLDSDVYVGRPERERSRIEQMNAFHTTLVRALHSAGVPLLTGTDTPLPGLVPGFSLHDELDALVGAGMTPEESLRAATAEAGRFVRENVDAEAAFGTIEQGAAADLVLVESDPRAGLATLRRPLGVMVRGTWYDRNALHAMLVSVAGAPVADPDPRPR
jgi:imidazolonepropionase-like amidohydrolase